MLNWRELAEAEQSGIEIGAHTCEHPQLDQLPENWSAKSFNVSKSLPGGQPGTEGPWAGLPVRLLKPPGPAGWPGTSCIRRRPTRWANALTTSAGGRVFALPRLTVPAGPPRLTTSARLVQPAVGHDECLQRDDRILTSEVLRWSGAPGPRLRSLPPDGLTAEFAGAYAARHQPSPKGDGALAAAYAEEPLSGAHLPAWPGQWRRSRQWPMRPGSPSWRNERSTRRTRA